MRDVSQRRILSMKIYRLSPIIVSCIEDTSDEFTHDGAPEILFPKDE